MGSGLTNKEAFSRRKTNGIEGRREVFRNSQKTDKEEVYRTNITRVKE